VLPAQPEPVLELPPVILHLISFSALYFLLSFKIALSPLDLGHHGLSICSFLLSADITSLHAKGIVGLGQSPSPTKESNALVRKYPFTRGCGIEPNLHQLQAIIGVIPEILIQGGHIEYPDVAKSNVSRALVSGIIDINIALSTEDITDVQRMGLLQTFLALHPREVKIGHQHVTEGPKTGRDDKVTKVETPNVAYPCVDTLFQQEQVMSQVHTRDVITSLLKQKKNKRVKNSTLQTYEKHLYRFEREFPWMPEELSLILDYLAGFTGVTGRYKRNQQDLLNMLYRHATRFLGMPKNPMAGLERPQVAKRPIKTISLDTAWLLNNTLETLAERVALDMLLGHGWRQIEVRRILSADVVSIRDGLIFCRGKEREEWAPVLPEAEERLQELARGLSPSEYVFVSQRIYRGKREPLGEDVMSQLINRLYVRAGITGMTGHDLRRSFATLVTAASNDEFLAMRLLRDKIPGQSDRYINFPLIQLAEALKRYSPL